MIEVEYLINSQKVINIELVYYPDNTTGFTVWFSNYMALLDYVTIYYNKANAVEKALNKVLEPINFSIENFKFTGPAIGVGIVNNKIEKLYISSPDGGSFGVNLNNDDEVIESKYYKVCHISGNITKTNLSMGSDNVYELIDSTACSEYKDGDDVKVYFSDKSRMYVIIGKSVFKKYFERIVTVIHKTKGM